MASNINSDSIDALYPVAGQDNDSQGFRDNFTTIKNSFATAKTEITALQTNSAKLNEDNDFNGNKISEANMQANTEEVNNIGNITVSQNINWTDGHYQRLQAGGDLTLTLTSWPTSGVLGRMTLEITGDGTEREITFAASGGGGFRYDGDFPSPFAVTSSNTPLIVDLWTSNGGQVIYAKYLGTFS